MNELMVFNNPEFGTIRTIEESGKVLFCGNDAAKALGYKRPKDAVSAHCKGAVKRRTLTKGGEQEMLFIPEGDIYRLAAKSELPGAERFESWIFDEVLPTETAEAAWFDTGMVFAETGKPIYAFFEKNECLIILNLSISLHVNDYVCA